MQLLGSIILRNLCFLQFRRGVYLVHWTHSILYFYNTTGIFKLQDGKFHKKLRKNLENMRIDKNFSL